MPSTYTESSLKVLRKNGYRITQPRRKVVELLDTTTTALSAYEIRDLLDEAKNHVDIVSIYRIIECLEQNHLIHRVLVTGKIRKCQIVQAGHCHHFLVCKHCGDLQEMVCGGLESLARQVEAKTRFKVEEHYLELTGICDTCSEKLSSPST